MENVIQAIALLLQMEAERSAMSLGARVWCGGSAAPPIVGEDWARHPTLLSRW
jgi:hypothetical protein